jgi:hypothetical protein
MITILFFGAFWGIKGQRRRGIVLDKYSLSLDQISDGCHKKSLWDKIHLTLEPFIFSATIFLSGTKLFVDPPEVPEMPGLSNSLINGVFNLERILGAFLLDPVIHRHRGDSSKIIDYVLESHLPPMMIYPEPASIRFSLE